MAKKVIAKAWTFVSSNGVTKYQTLAYTDGTTSCECPGWTRRSVRNCKHTRCVDMGTADAQAESSVTYVGNISTATRAMKTGHSNVGLGSMAKNRFKLPAKTGPCRKIRFEND